jgi:hypothetical protein
MTRGIARRRRAPAQRRDHVLVQRLAHAPGSLVRSSTAIVRTVARQRGQELRCGRERPVQAHREHAHLLALGATSLATASREAPTPEPIMHHDAFGVGRAVYSNRL